jgi:hypothetical protein
MTGFAIAPIDVAELRAHAAYEGGKLVVAFAGSADSRAMTSIGSLLKELHGEMVRAGLPEVTIDFRDFEFMNSSCFKAFVVWISDLRELESAKRYRISFRSNPGKHWQRRSLDALRCFAAEVVHVDT